MTRLVSRRIALLPLGLAALLALALGLWLGAFEAERAAADPIDMTVDMSGTTPASGTTMAQGSIIRYTVAVTTDVAPGVSVPLNIALSGGEVVTGSVTPPTGITCPTIGAASINCTVASTFTGTGSVVFNGKLTSATAMQVGAALDLPPPGVVEEGVGGNDAGDDGDDDVLNCPTVGEGTDNAPPEEPDNFDCTEHAVGLANLTITKAASTPVEDALVGAGTAISYTITVTNAGPAVVGGVVVRDYLDTDLTFSSIAASPPGSDVTCASPVGQTVDCTISSLGRPAGRWS